MPATNETLTYDALGPFDMEGWWRTVVNDSKASWSGIFRIDATPAYFFIFTQPNAAHVIPRRAFPTTEAAERFLSTARAYHEAAAIPSDLGVPRNTRLKVLRNLDLPMNYH